MNSITNKLTQLANDLRIALQTCPLIPNLQSIINDIIQVIVVTPSLQQLFASLLLLFTTIQSSSLSLSHRQLILCGSGTTTGILTSILALVTVLGTVVGGVGGNQCQQLFTNLHTANLNLIGAITNPINLSTALSAFNTAIANLIICLTQNQPVPPCDPCDPCGIISKKCICEQLTHLKKKHKKKHNHHKNKDKKCSDVLFF